MNRRRLLATLAAAPLAPLTGLDPLASATIRMSAANPATTPHAAAQGMRHGQPPEVEAIVLGTAQDAGVPQVNCFKDHCARVRSGAAPAPRVSSIGIVDRVADRRFILDATPDFTAQVGALLGPGAMPDAVAGRTVPLHEHLHGVFITHMHMGHYTGLAQIGREAAGARLVPVWGSEQMCDFLRTNAPWDALVEREHIELRVAAPGERVELTERLSITPFAVVHRAEYTDTLGYRAHGPERTMMFVPDADVWDGWEVPFEQLLRACDLALIDGSFWSHDELGHRVQADIPHPPVSVSIERLRDMSDRPEIRFIHLNHTNPLWDPAAPQHAELPPGFAVAQTGERHGL